MDEDKKKQEEDKKKKEEEAKKKNLEGLPPELQEGNTNIIME